MANSKELAQRFKLPEYMTLSDVCELMNCSERFIKQEVKRKNLKAYKPVRDLLFMPEDVALWIKRKQKSA